VNTTTQTLTKLKHLNHSHTAKIFTVSQDEKNSISW